MAMPPKIAFFERQGRGNAFARHSDHQWSSQSSGFRPACIFLTASFEGLLAGSKGVGV
jgi:hypothetical protein